MRRIVSVSVALFALNAFLSWPLFRIEYLDQFQSNEGSWMALAKFLQENWPHVSWFPWFNAGMPFENTYLPGVGALVAVVSIVGRCSPAHAIHIVAAMAYSLAPVFLFLFAREVSGRIAPSALAALLWSLVSPSIIFPTLFRDLNTYLACGASGTSWFLARRRTTSHSVCCQLPSCSHGVIWKGRRPADSPWPLWPLRL